MLDRLRARAGGVAVVVLAALIVHNLAWAVRNQRGLPPSLRPHVSSTSLAEVTAANKHPSVHGRLAIYYLLAERIPGATLTVSTRFADAVWMFERVARQRVEVSEQLLVLPVEHEQSVRDAAEHRRWFVRGSKGAELSYRELYLLLDDDSRDFVLATSTTSSDLFLVPASLLGAPPP